VQQTVPFGAHSEVKLPVEL
jgi:hypothetical protein